MTTTNSAALTTAWSASLVSDGDDFTLRNTGVETIWLWADTSAPSATDVGFPIKAGEVITRDEVPNGNIYLREETINAAYALLT